MLADHAPPAETVFRSSTQRWGTADETVVALELLTVFLAGPIAVYIAYLMAKNVGAAFEGRRFLAIHFWTIILSTMELYGGFMTFAPEWLTGSQQLRTGMLSTPRDRAAGFSPAYTASYLDNFLHCWIYLFLMNTMYGIAAPM